MMNFDTTKPDPEHPCRITPPGAQSDGQKPGTADQSLRAQIEALIPRLRRYARALARDPVAADDLVQDCLVRALGKIHLWETGTDLRAWLFTILHNQYVSLARQAARQRDSIELQQSNPGLPLSPTQTARLELRDLERAIAKLPEEQRSLILLVGLEGMGYEEAASVVNLPIGTVRSRVSRGRETLRMMTELFPNRHSRRPGTVANLSFRRRQAPHGNHFKSRSPQMLQ
jgi:RNA polymerase sigma-70 factor (ECF subfamily)